MATTAERRAWLIDHGHPELEGGKGKLSAALEQEYAAGQPTDNYAAGAGPGDFATATDPPGSGIPAAAGADDPPGEPAPVEEERPSRPGRGSARARARSRWGRGGGTRQAKPAKPRKRKGPRLSVAPFIEDLYSDLAWASKGIHPALQRLLYAQAPVAGVVLDPVVKDTVLDRVALQPAVRNYQRMQVGMALVGTPAALMMVLATAPAPVMIDGQIVFDQVADPDTGEPLIQDGQPVITPRMTEPAPAHMLAMVQLRYCVRAMAALSGADLERVTQRAAENEERDGQVDRFIAYLLGTEVPADREETERRQGAAAGLTLAGAR